MTEHSFRTVPPVDIVIMNRALIAMSGGVDSSQPATVTVMDDGRLTLEFDEPQRAITPGQAVVLYEDNTVLGGGTILKAVR